MNPAELTPPSPIKAKATSNFCTMLTTQCILIAIIIRVGEARQVSDSHSNNIIMW